ncbi:hypothetical protein E3J62_05555 [candidate division TA06 bacterium]|uniref:VCBS repeat-containing protein n=1 Tax=candidate division TA06 bacterium TaxID=2250710 RepID=A0A523UTX4_UNCT6|nr:MAG: hypothetical protein E3J62_05555 [candidate division TA06 bacterium]
MLKLLAKVKKTRRLDSFRGEDGLLRSRVHCYVAIRSAARSTMKLPKGLKGKSVRVLRTYIHPWEIKPGDLIVLDTNESRAAVKKHVRTSVGKRAEVGFGSKNVTVGDFNSDGLKEYAIENAFLRSIISPDYGARILELWNLGTDKNELYGGNSYEPGGYIEIGGVEESLSRIGSPGDLWNASYKKRDVAGSDLGFEHNLKKKEGLKEVKSFFVLPDAPVFCQLSTFEYKPKKPKKKKGKIPETELEYVPRIFFAIGGKADHTNLFFIPTDERLVRSRYNAFPWWTRWGGGIWLWKKMWHAVKPGFVLLGNEMTNECMAVFVNPKELSYVWVGNDRWTPRLFLAHHPRKMKAKRSVDYGLAFSLGVGYDVTKNSLLMLSKGRKVKGGIPYAVIYRSLFKAGPRRAVFTFDGEIKTVELKKERMKGAGNIYYSSLLLEAEPGMVSVEIKTSKERLRASWRKNETTV